MSWMSCRQAAQRQTLESALITVNDWWFRLPWQPYYLHWDDRQDWPDPWQLLHDNIYCDIARGLGICYTLVLMEHAEIQHFELVSHKDANLVLVNQGKYILNYEPGRCVNTNLDPVSVQRRITQQEITKRIE